MHTFDRIDSRSEETKSVYTLVYTFLTENLSISEDTSLRLSFEQKKGLGILNLGSSGRGGVSLRGLKSCLLIGESREFGTQPDSSFRFPPRFLRDIAGKRGLRAASSVQFRQFLGSNK